MADRPLPVLLRPLDALGAGTIGVVESLGRFGVFLAQAVAAMVTPPFRLTALADLAGYVIRYGRDPGVLDQSVSIPNPGITQYVVDDLVEGTWYFSLASINGAGVESRPTDVVAKSIG